MKNTIVIFKAIRSMAIIALVAVIGFSLAACDPDDDGGDVSGGSSLSLGEDSMTLSGPVVLEDFNMTSMNST